MPSHPHCHWRGLKDWQKFGLEFSTPSDEACKMYDACLTQIVNHFDDPAVGGSAGCFTKMFTADPNFLMGHVLKVGMAGQLVRHDFAHAQEVYKMAMLARQPGVKPWERKHADAVQYFCEGKVNKACCTWEDILVENPTDMLALEFLHDMYIVNGQSRGLRDSCGRVLPYWKQDWPFYGDLLAMHAYGLEETNFYDRAEQTARKALEINPNDAWAAHCVAHCKEMTGQYEEGIAFMAQTENNWNVLPSMRDKKTMLSVTDAASLCFRLQAEGYDVGSGWDDCYSVAKLHVKDNFWSFFDVNVMLSCVGAKQKADENTLISEVKETIRDGTGDLPKVYNEVTLPILEAMQAYEEEDFDKAVQIMRPLKYDVYKIGGSHAQRDLLNVFTIHAGIRSKIPENRRYASHLLMERKNLKESPLADRLLQRLVESH